MRTRTGAHIYEREAARVALVLVVALLQGLLYLWLLPPWQHYDEPAHFEYAWLIASRGRLPAVEDVDETMRRELVASMLTHDFYGAQNQIAPVLIAPTRDLWIGVSQAPQPPAYYVLLSLPLRAVRHLDLTTQLYLARSLSVGFFLLTVLTAYGLVRDLTAPGHPLRIIVPLALALIPPFADLMTAASSDVAVTLTCSLFLWASVRIIRYGLTGARLVALGGTAVLAVATKNTANPVLLLAPLAVAVSLPALRHWTWKGPVAGALALCLVAIAATVEWGDAAVWYRWYQLEQDTATRRLDPAAPLGAHVIVIETKRPDPNARLLNPVLERHLEQLAGQTVTVGGWVWADRPGWANAPGLGWSEWGTLELKVEAQPIELTTSPVWVARTFRVPEQVGKLYYALPAAASEGGPARVYLDGALLVAGEFSPGSAPVLADDAAGGVWEGKAITNLIRNGSGEQGWPRLRPWLERLLIRSSRPGRVPTLAPLLDVERTGFFLVRRVPRALLYNFFATHAWGNVTLDGRWLPVFQAVGLVAVAGSLRWWLASRKPGGQGLALGYLALAGVLVWGSAILWTLPYFWWGKISYPPARYTYPTVLTTVLLLCGGWWAFWPRPLRMLATIALLLGLAAFNLLSAWTIWRYYS
ncbi:MAG TPA: hypothetical protein VER55_01675 [Ardenticatenaceae bacterium]|nr:hypothetical protein [Ardenticatenaceae bacterium]